MICYKVGKLLTQIFCYLFVFFCLPYYNQYSIIMGNNTISSQISANSSQTQEMQQVSRLYYSKLFINNRKSLNQFKLAISSINKRLSYLPYPWAHTFQTQLQFANNDQIYAEYRKILKSNLKRQGRKETIFYSPQLQRCFLKHVHAHYKLNTLVITPRELKCLIEEYKSYIMVLSWLNQLTTSKNIDNIDTKTSNYVQDQKAYNMLLKAIMKMSIRQQSNVSKEIHLDEALCSNPILAQLIKLKTSTKFIQKERSIGKIQKMLMNSKQERDVNLVVRTIKNSHMFVYVLVVRQLGNMNIDFLWEKIDGSSLQKQFY